ncbi:MAG TPA: esterase-like activity of phytase family protein [Xanthobacteraceae bacterium]|nr:esterase-like activity of phytase family protein [Xanthobacteraceae bacterium]
MRTAAGRYHRIGDTISMRWVIGLLAAVLTFAPLSAETVLPGVRPVAITVAAVPIESFDPRDPSQRRFGALQFRGGLQLTSNHANFGGFSSIRVAPDGHFISASDKGRWLRGRIVYRGERPVAIADAEMAPILGPDGRPLIARGWYDTESIAQDGDTLYVGIERVNRIVRFDYGRDGLLARGEPIPVPEGIAKLPRNQGLEAMAFVPAGLPHAGALIAVSERGLDAHGNIRAFLLEDGAWRAFEVMRRDDFDVSDCAVTPAGDLLLLERRFGWTSGLAIRIRRISLAKLGADALVDGPALFQADLGYQIDNMEGLSVHRDDADNVVLTLISDDNFSLLQRTLLLQFTLLPE